MKSLTKVDWGSALVTGLTTGIIGWRILVFLGARLPMGMHPVYLVIIVPILWLMGVQLGYFLGQWMSFFDQFGRFAAIGFTNAAVDFGVLYLLIGVTDIAVGREYSLFKALSFTVATIHSYAWNKYWAFASAKSSAVGKEFLSFISVSLIALLINVAAASLVVSMHGASFGLSDAAWAGIGAVVGSAAALIASFVGYKFLVFKK